MKRLFISAAVTAALGLGASYVGLTAAFGQANEDDVASRQAKYPLAAKAGVDSHADKIAPPGAVNQGVFDDKTWKFGHRTDAPANRISRALTSDTASTASRARKRRRPWRSKRLMRLSSRGI